MIKYEIMINMCQLCIDIVIKLKNICLNNGRNILITQ